jgi:hypothetical protein
VWFVVVQALLELATDLIGSAPELAKGATDGPSDFGQSLRAEHQQSDDQNDDELCGADVEQLAITPGVRFSREFTGESASGD